MPGAVLRMRRFFQMLGSKDYPTLSELYGLIRRPEYKGEFDSGEQRLYTTRAVAEHPFGLHSMCRGPEASFQQSYQYYSSRLRHFWSERGSAGQPGTY